MTNPEILGIFDHETDPFQADPPPFDVVCAGDSLTGWGNFGPAESWPFRCYPESLQVLCEPLGLKVATYVVVPYHSMRAFAVTNCPRLGASEPKCLPSVVTS